MIIQKKYVTSSLLISLILSCKAVTIKTPDAEAWNAQVLGGVHQHVGRSARSEHPLPQDGALS